MHIAARRLYLPVVKHLFSIGAFLPTDILFAAELVELRVSSDRMLMNLPSSMIHFLLSKGADAMVIAANGDNALNSALRSNLSRDDSVGCLESTGMLVAAGCDPNITNSSGQTSLDVAVASGCISVVKHLLSLNAPLSPYIFLTACGGSYRHSTHFLAMIRVLLNQGADPNMTMPDGDSALPLALARNYWWSENSFQAVVRALVAVGCDPSARDTKGRTVFHIAAGHGYIKIMEYLLSQGTSLPPDILLHAPSYNTTTTQTIQFLIDKGADARAVSATGDTPLHCVINFSGPESTSLEFARLLIAAGSDPCAFNEAHETPMHKAATRGHISVIDYLLSLGAPLPRDILLAPFSVSSYFETRLVTTSPVVRFLVYKRGNTTAVTAKGDTILHLALAGQSEMWQSDRLETTKILVEAGCNIHACNSTGERPLHAAARSGYIDIVKYLLSQGATSLPHDIFLAAARGGHIKVMEYLLSRGALVPPAALLAAAENWAKLRTVQFLATLPESADLYIVAPDGDTVLHRAVSSGSEEECLETAKLLVHLGCDPSSRNLAGEMPLHISARQHHISVLRYLLSQGVPLPSNVLLFAASGDWLGDPESLSVTPVAMMRFLIREGANPYVVDDKGDTPLHILLRHDIGNRMPGWRAIQMLLNAGANPHARNLNGQTPIDLAEQAGPFFVKNFMRLVKEANESNAHMHH